MARNYESAILLTGDASGAVRAIELTDDHLRQLNARQQRNQATTREQSASWETLSNSLKGAAAALGLSVAGVVALSTNQLRAVTETDRLAKSIGVQTDRLQAMQYAAKFAGLESDNMGDILKDVADKIGDAVSNGGGEAIDVINNLGLSAQKLVAMSPDEQLLAIADGLDRLGSRAQQVNALEALGNDASRLLPLLENNAAELRRLMQESYDLNVAMRPEDIDSFVQAQSAIETMGAAVQGLSNTLLIDLAPVVTDSVESIRAWIDEMGGMEVVVDRIATAFGVAIDVAQVLFAVWLGGKASKYLKDSKGLFTSLGAVGVGAMQLIAASTTGVNRALLVTQGRIAATAAASRGLAAAVGLLGGPAGVALLAAGAVYTYREELGLVDMSAQNATDALRENERAIKSGSQASLDNSYDALTESLNEVSLKAQEAILQLRELEARQGFYDKSHGGVADSVSGAIDTQRAVLDDLQQRQIELQAAIEDNRQRREKLASGAAESNIVEASSVKPLVDAYDQYHVKMEQLHADRAKLQQLIKDDPEHAEQYRRMLAEVDSQITSLTKSTTSDTDAKRAAQEAERAHQQALDESAQAYSRLFSAMSPVGAAQAEYDSTLADLKVELEEGTKSTLEYYAAVAQAAVEYNKAVKAADPYADTVRDLVQQYDDAYRRGQQLEQALLDVNAAYQRGDIDGQQYQRMLAAIRDDMRELARESDPAAQEMARAWEEAADRIDETFADAFAGAFDGFDDFADQLLDGFKRLLAELAYQATLKPIVVQFTGQMQSMLGIPGTGANSGSGTGGGFGGMSMPSMDTLSGAWNTAQNAYAGYTGTYGASLGVQGGVSGTAIGSANAVANGTGITGASNAAFGSGSTASSLASSFGTALAYYAAFEGGGYLGNSVGEGLTGKHANSNYGQMAGTAIGTYFGGVPGAFIGSTLGGIVDSVFGSSREPKVKGWQGALGSNGDNEYRDYHADSALGTFTILDKVKTEPEDILNMLDMFTQVDNGLADLMTDSQLSAVKDDFSQGWKLNEKSVGGIIEERYDRLDDVLVDSAKEAYTKALLERAPEIEGDDIDEDVAALGNALQLNKIIDGLSGNIKDYAIGVAEDTSETIEQSLADVQSSIAVNSLLSDAADTLNLKFDALADGAIEAGNRIAELAGGVDSLSSTYSSYYQAVFSDNERLSDSYQSLGEQFDALGVEMPNNVDALRDLVEAQALNTDEGRKLQLQLQLMQLAPTFAETTSSIRDALTQQYQDVLDRAPDAEGLNYWIDEIQSGSVSLEHALASIANSAEATTAELREIMQSASDAYESAMSQARDYLAGITNSLSEYIDQLHSTDAGLASPGDQLAAAAGAFSEQYQLALSGDRDALGSITQYASRLIDAQTQWSGSGTQTQDVIADITSKLEQLPERLSPEQFLADEIRDAITDGISDLTDGIATTIAGSFEAIDFNQDDVIDWSEFRRQFEGLVDNDTLRDIFGALDNNGNGVIDQLESDARAIEAWSSQQPESAQSAIQEMLDMYEEILGRQADLPGIDYYLDQYFDGMSLEEIRARLEDSPEAGGGSSSGGGSGSTGGSYKPGGSDAEGDPLLSDASGDLADAFRDVLGRDPDDSGYAYYQDQLNSGSMTLDEIRDRLADSPEANGYALGGAFVGGVQAFAKGGAFTNGIVTEPTLFDMAQMGEAGPEAIMPLSRGADGSLGVRAELPPVVIPPPAAMGQFSGAIERLLQENNRLMQENTALLKRLDAHGAASVRVAQAGHQRQIEATERGNRSLDDLAAGARLESAR